MSAVFDKVAAGAPSPLIGPQRVAWLFRHQLRRHQVHPLLPAVLQYHGAMASALGEPAAGPAVAGSKGPATDHRIDAAVMAREVGDLPSLPKALLDAMALMRQDDSSVVDLARSIEQDQALTARALRVANSAFYGVSGRVGTVRNAIDVLGRRTVQSLLTTAALAAQFSPPRASGLDHKDFWRHAMATAMCARSLAGALELDGELAFTGGLLHDIGVLALAMRFPAAVAAVGARERETDQPRLEIERELLGLTHAEVGAMVARHWHFPPEVVIAIEQHHAPQDSGTDRPGLGDIVHVADAIAHGLDLGHQPWQWIPTVAVHCWSRLALPTATVHALMQSTGEQVNGLCEALLS